MYRWINYAAAGDQRELTTLKRETKANNNETLVPCKASLFYFLFFIFACGNPETSDTDTNKIVAVIDFAILSTEPNKINVTSVSYSSPYKSNRPMTQSIEKEDLKHGMQRMAVFINSNLSTSDMEYFEVVVQHQSPLPAYPWFRINLFSPPRSESNKKGTARIIKHEE